MPGREGGGNEVEEKMRGPHGDSQQVEEDFHATEMLAPAREEDAAPWGTLSNHEAKASSADARAMWMTIKLPRKDNYLYSGKRSGARRRTLRQPRQLRKAARNKPSAGTDS